MRTVRAVCPSARCVGCFGLHARRVPYEAIRISVKLCSSYVLVADKYFVVLKSHESFSSGAPRGRSIDKYKPAYQCVEYNDSCNFLLIQLRLIDSVYAHRQWTTKYGLHYI